MVPRRRPLIRQKRRQCSRMGSTSQDERKVVPGTDCHHRIQESEETAEPSPQRSNRRHRIQESEETAEPSPQRSKKHRAALSSGHVSRGDRI